MNLTLRHGDVTDWAEQRDEHRDRTTDVLIRPDREHRQRQNTERHDRYGDMTGDRKDNTT